MQHWLLLLALISPVALAQAQETVSPSPSATAAPAGPKERIADVQKKRDALAQRRGETQRALQAARQKPEDHGVADLEQQVALLQQLDAIFVQQASALQNGLTLAAEQRQYVDSLKSSTQPAPTESIPFAELDRVQEELDGLAARKSALHARLKQATDQLWQAQDEVKRQRDRVSGVESSKPAESGDGSTPDALSSARLQLELAQETLTLRQLEERNANRAIAAFNDQQRWLEQQALSLEQRTVFSKDELASHAQDIEKEEFAVKRRLVKAREQQPTTAARLAAARHRLNQATLDLRPELADEVEAKRLADEVPRVSVDLLTRRIELLADWKTLWQRRYAVFNELDDQSTWLKWKQDASSSIEAVDREERLIALWLNDWQKQLITLKNELAGLDGHTSAARWIDQQRQNTEKIIDAYQEQRTFLENTRRLQQKLITRITERTAHRSWREWLQLTLDYELDGNRLGHWLGSAGSAIGLFAFLVFLRNSLVTRLQEHAEEGDARLTALFFASVRRTTSFFLLMMAVFLSALWLDLEPSTYAFLKHLTMVALIFQGAIWLSYFFSSWIRYDLSRRAKRDATSKGALSIFNFVSQAAVWSIASLLILQNLGIDVTALATGLGIGGVAVALALQRILGDLFSSLSIVLDKPFVAGDFIIVDKILGTVEHIGIKTTRIRSLDGEQIICANSDLLETRIRNFQRMRERRVVFQIGVVYQTGARQLASIPQILRDIVSGQERTRFDRAHFKSYGDFALLFETVYYVTSPDYNVYMDIQQAINLAIFDRFEAEGIEFAYPTQSLYVQGQPRSAMGRRDSQTTAAYEEAAVA